MVVDWPARGNRGKDAERRHQTDRREPPKQRTITALIASEAALYYESFSEQETYTGRDSDPLAIVPIEDRSLTETRHLKLFKGKRAGLLKKGNPFGMPDDFYRLTSKSKRRKWEQETDADASVIVSSGPRSRFDGRNGPVKHFTRTEIEAIAAIILPPRAK